MSLATAWRLPDVRAPLLLGLTSHLVMRLWSAFDFIPKLDLVTCTAMFLALIAAARLG